MALTRDGRRFHLHLVSDATGETINSVARACLVQFEGIDADRAYLVADPHQRARWRRCSAAIAANPGIVLFTLVNDELRSQLREGCRKLQMPCIPVLDPVHRRAGQLSRPAGQRPAGPASMSSTPNISPASMP